VIVDKEARKTAQKKAHLIHTLSTDIISNGKNATYKFSGAAKRT
jgi:hypothetical protein